MALENVRSITKRRFNGRDVFSLCRRLFEYGDNLASVDDLQSLVQETIPACYEEALVVSGNVRLLSGLFHCRLVEVFDEIVQRIVNPPACVSSCNHALLVSGVARCVGLPQRLALSRVIPKSVRLSRRKLSLSLCLSSFLFMLGTPMLMDKLDLALQGVLTFCQFSDAAPPAAVSQLCFTLARIRRYVDVWDAASLAYVFRNVYYDENNVPEDLVSQFLQLLCRDFSSYMVHYLAEHAPVFHGVPVFWWPVDSLQSPVQDMQIKLSSTWADGCVADYVFSRYPMRGLDDYSMDTSGITILERDAHDFHGNVRYQLRVNNGDLLHFRERTLQAPVPAEVYSSEFLRHHPRFFASSHYERDDGSNVDYRRWLGELSSSDLNIRASEVQESSGYIDE